MSSVFEIGYRVSIPPDEPDELPIPGLVMVSGVHNAFVPDSSFGPFRITFRDP